MVQDVLVCTRPSTARKKSCHKFYMWQRLIDYGFVFYYVTNKPQTWGWLSKCVCLRVSSVAFSTRGMHVTRADRCLVFMCGVATDAAQSLCVVRVWHPRGRVYSVPLAFLFHLLSSWIKCRLALWYFYFVFFPGRYRASIPTESCSVAWDCVGPVYQQPWELWKRI